MKAPAQRGRRFEREMEEAWGEVVPYAKRFGRPHEPDLVVGIRTPEEEVAWDDPHAYRRGLACWVVECKNETRLAVSANAIEKARADGKEHERHWAVAKKQKGHHGFTVTLDGDTFLRILAEALRG